MLFVTGPGKASIENHFDLNDELIQTLRETGKEELLDELEFERSAVQYFYTRQRQLLGLGHAVLCAKSFVGRQPVHRRAGRLDHRHARRRATSSGGWRAASSSATRWP